MMFVRSCLIVFLSLCEVAIRGADSAIPMQFVFKNDWQMFSAVKLGERRTNVENLIGTPNGGADSEVSYGRPRGTTLSATFAINYTNGVVAEKSFWGNKSTIEKEFLATQTERYFSGWLENAQAWMTRVGGRHFGGYSAGSGICFGFTLDHGERRLVVIGQLDSFPGQGRKVRMELPQPGHREDSRPTDVSRLKGGQCVVVSQPRMPTLRFDMRKHSPPRGGEISFSIIRSSARFVDGSVTLKLDFDNGKIINVEKTVRMKRSRLVPYS